MQKKKTELLELLGKRSLFDYGEERELIDELKGITKYYLPEHLVYHKGMFEAVQNAFKYGAIMGIRHERKMRKEKANRALESTPECKRRLVELVKDIPWWADTTCNYLYAFIAFGMLNGKFRMSEGHKKELEIFKTEYDREQELKQREKREVKKEIFPKNRLLASSLNMLCEIKREDAQEYLNVIIADVYKEVCHE